MKYVTFIAAMLMNVNVANAEIRYDYQNPSHTDDMICIAALSIGRDAMFGFNNDKFQEFTQIQNSYILRYAYSRQLNRHVDARKILLKGYGNQYVNDLIDSCIENM